MINSRNILIGLVIVAMSLLTVGGFLYHPANVFAAKPTADSGADSGPKSINVNVPNIAPDGGEIQVDSTLRRAMDAIERWLLIIAVALIIIVLIWGAIMYMTAGGNEERSETAGKIIKNGIIGAVILFALSIILRLLKGAIVGMFGT